MGLVGGIEVAGATVGLNTDKVWGSVRVIGIGLGIVYYWGDEDSFDFGIGVGETQPTYPELLPALQGSSPYFWDTTKKRARTYT